MVSSDWNECLAPTGPFDPIAFHYPDLRPKLDAIFKEYTGNRIPLSEALRRIQALLPGPFTENQMDAYLDASFAAYRGVPELIEWCLAHDILFMINTTGFQGFFQRVIAKGLLPAVPAISAHPMIRYDKGPDDPAFLIDLLEIQDKAKNTQGVMRELGIPPGKVIVIGDSGGDGPHFEWAAKAGAKLIGSMTKPSLEQYCTSRGIEMTKRFGVSYAPGEKRDLQKEMEWDFMSLTGELGHFLHLPKQEVR
jgi:phosphoserine phosphatase